MRKLLALTLGLALLCGGAALISCGTAATQGDGGADASQSVTSGTAQGSAEQLKANLEGGGFSVQQGEFNEFDTIQMASEGKLASCFGNNAGSVYTIFNLPPAPEQDAAQGNPQAELNGELACEYDDPDVANYPANPYFFPAGWSYKLRSDEAIVLVTQLPPECKYYSFCNYLMFTQEKEGKDYSDERSYFQVGNDQTGYYHPIFGSIGSTVNMANAKHAGSSAFSTQAVIVISANKAVTGRVVTQLVAAGYPEDSINVMSIPKGTYSMGLEKGADTFCFLGRVSQPADEAAYESYIEGLSQCSIVYRVTPSEQVPSDPYANETLTVRGNGVHEAALLDDAEENLDAIRSALIAKYSGEYDYEELSADIAVPEGLTAYTKDVNALGDNKDTSYLMTEEFTLDSDEDFVVVYGVNHTATGKATYSNAVLYAKPMLNGVCSVYDSLFADSAAEYLGDGTDAGSYYVYKMARTQMDDYTKIVEYSTGNERGAYYGMDNGNPLVMAYRAYMDSTGVGPSYYEIIYDRAIVFHKK